MTSTTDAAVAAPVRKSVTVKTTIEHAFRIFTDDFDSWWPRTHHIGKSPMKTGVVEGRAGGRCYTLQEDGTESDWGQVIAWEPPHRLVLAWQITPEWGYEPDLAQSSEVEIRFTPAPDGATEWISNIATSSVTGLAPHRCGMRSTRKADGAACSTSTHRG